MQSLKLAFLSLVALFFFASQEAHATVIAQDTAADAVYNDGWQTGDNGGTGFGAWTIRTTTGANDSNNGVFVGSSKNNGDGDTNGDHDINTPLSATGRALGMYANNGYAAVGYRAFNVPLTIGHTFYLSMDNGYIDSGGPSVGFTLRTGNANSSTADYNAGARFEFLFVGGDSGYKVVDGTGVHFFSPNIGFTDEGLRIEFFLTGLNTYSIVVSNTSGTVLSSRTGTLGGTLNAPIESFAVYNRGAGAGSARDAFFNSFTQLSAVPEPGVALMLVVGGGLIWVRRRMAR